MQSQDAAIDSAIPAPVRRDATVTGIAVLLAMMIAVTGVAAAWLLTDTPFDTEHVTLFVVALAALTLVTASILWRLRRTLISLRSAFSRLADNDARYKALAEESESLRTLLVDAVESIDEGFVLFDHDNRLVVCNDRYRKAYPAIADLLRPGTRFDDILTTAAERIGVARGASNQDLRHWVHHRMQRHLEGKDFTECSLSDGRWYRISEQPTRSGGIVKLLMDITAAKTHERDLAHKNELLETVFDAMSQGLAVFDENEFLVAWNDRFARTMGYPASLLKVNSSADDFRAFDDDRKVSALPSVAQAAANGTSPKDGTVPGLDVALPDGRFIEAGINPLPRGGFVATFADITARRQAEAALQHSQKMDAVGQLAGGIAHEFNNMLTSIGGFARMALRTPCDSERVVMCLQEVTKAADRAASLTGQLLNFSRRTADEETQPLRVEDLLHDLSGFLRPLLGERFGVTLDIAEPDLMVTADIARLHQAVVNLCINARDAMADGGDIAIRLSAYTADDTFADGHPSVTSRDLVAIEVRDTGCGINETIIDRIFEPFFTTKDQGKGTGLGLPQVYSTTEHLGGAVEVSSQVGQGSVFTILLPRFTASDTVAPKAEGTTTLSGQGYTILLAEDEESVRRYLTMELEDKGFTVLTATDGDEALAIYRDSSKIVDALITDVVMPNKTGPDLAREILAEEPDLPILFMSGYSAEDAWRNLAEGPHRALLGKPVDIAVLAETLGRILDIPQAPAA